MALDPKSKDCSALGVYKGTTFCWHPPGCAATKWFLKTEMCSSAEAVAFSPNSEPADMLGTYGAIREG